ncbi:MAG: dihydrolipoyl dehydrogenase [Proteobacteria bacterium]|nr:dihydrolipoyl dehydrogenase [Pseudomonadota bacterium]MBU1582563.1 dihydrolipoyl dehydrogenase [Pseudomonadota bacterium]MBU2630739.1 dihydrolipoyl dehydrogenase [Pseudomonadota bacterium]
MATKIIVIGGGPGGYEAALRAAALGGDVTLIEKEHLGGTCLNWGCIPSKIMKNSADIFLKCLKADQFGIKIQGTILPDMKALMEKKEKIVETQRKGIAAMLQGRNIAVEKGTAKIKSSGIVEVDLNDGSKKELEYDRLIIATGTKPLNVADFPFDHTRILSSNDILQLDEIPKSIVIVGGGVIGCEFAFIFSALGSQVTIVEAMSRLLPLPSVDEECSKLLLREMKKKKIVVLCDTIVKSSVIKDNLLSIHLDISPFTDTPNPKKLKTAIIESEKMAVCIGRSALSFDLGLEEINLKTTPPGWIQADEKMETNVKGVYAIGDILGPQKVMLAHVASHEGMVAAQNAMGKESVMDYNVIPSAIFTMPEIGTVGLSEIEAKKKGYEVDVFSINFRALGKAQAIDELAGTAKMIIEKESKKVLGVHLIGAHATDLIAEATLAIQHGLTAKQIAHTIHAHPTLAEIMGELSLMASGTPIHG